jgi:O-antigen ligase
MISSLIFFYNFYSIQRIQKELGQRVELITIGYNIWKTSPIFGVGLKNFFFHEISYQKNFSTTLLQPIHNIYAQVAVELGVVGLLTFIALLIFTAKRLASYLNKTSARICMILLISVCLVGLFDHYFATLQQGSLMLAIILGLSWSKIKESA